MSKLTLFFKSPDGGFPKIIYVLPILLILIGGLVYLTLNIKKGTVKKKIQAASMAVGLQDDINYISTKTKASEVFDLSKKEMIKAEKNESFLMARVKRKLDKSVFSESMGVNDETLAGFDDDLSPTLSDNPENTPGVSVGNMEVDSTQATDDLNYLMNKIKEDKKSKYHILEEQRKQRLANAKLENKRKRESLDQSTLSAEAMAYQKGLADNQAQYDAFHGTNTSQKAAVSNKRKTKKNGLSFSTATGLKDDLNLNVKKVPVTNIDNLPPIDPFAAQATALKAVIDQKQKFRTGDKIQLRVLDAGVYGQFGIPKNTLLYGICSISSNRLFVNISSINLNGKVIPSSLSVYDLDGIPGIYIDGAYQDATKQAINQGLADAGNLGLRNTLGNLSIKL
ncbi:MAG: conjugative transposon protein TraM, partial [Saprospiraceae bacterium]